MSFHLLRECFSTAPRGHPSVRQADDRNMDGGAVVVAVVFLLGGARLAYVVYGRWHPTSVARSKGLQERNKTAVDAGF